MRKHEVNSSELAPVLHGTERVLPQKRRGKTWKEADRRANLLREALINNPVAEARAEWRRGIKKREREREIAGNGI